MLDNIQKIDTNQQLMPPEQAAYLRLVRAGAGVLGFKPVNGKFYELRFKDDAEALSLIAANGTNAETWVSMATYSNPLATRTQDNAEKLCALWLDVDAHEGSKYASVVDVENALGAFIEQTALPTPTVINYTGYGIQALWALSQEISRSDWQPVADKLQDLGERMFLDADPITSDAARILRVAGTLNFRNPEEPKLAHYKQAVEELQSFDDFGAAVDAALLKVPAIQKKRNKHDKAKQFESAETQANIEIVKSQLACIDPDLDYCQWRNLVWSVASTGWGCSYDVARSWSANGDSWDEAAFNRVWDSFDGEKGIGFGTLVYYARNAGYVGELPSSSEPKPKVFESGRLKTVCAADIEPEHVEWLVDQSFPLGMLAVIGGQPGLGKSQISINLAAGVTTGKGLPGTGGFGNIGSVIILANEDDAARTIRPRLDAAGADISKIHIVEGVAREGAEVDMFQLDSDIADLRDRALEIGDVRLIIIDPPSAYLGTKVDSYKDSDVRRVLMPLGNLAQETGAMILLIVHLNKRTDGGAQQRFSGSTAWTAAPRVGFMVAEDTVSKQRFMLPVKNNIGDDRLGYQYHIAEKLIKYGGQSFKSSYIVWDQTTNRSVSEILAPPKASKESVVDDAKLFLEDELANGPVAVEQLQKLAKAAGLSWPSINRAKKVLPINSTKVSNGWQWTLCRYRLKDSISEIAVDLTQELEDDQNV
jgi:putative DNA primase/helicase